MGALLALQLRVMWRGTSGFFRVTLGILVFGLVAVLAKGYLSRDDMAVAFVGPLALLLFGVVSAIGSGESLTWFAPLAQSTRAWCRLAFLALTGVPVTTTILAIYAAAGVRVPNSWAILPLNLWTCWIGGGLLLLFLGDLFRARHVVIQIVCLLAGTVPGIAMSCYHLAEKCPEEVLLAEAGAVAILAVLTRLINQDGEMGLHPLIPKQFRRSGTELPEPQAPKPEVRSDSSQRNLDRVPSLSPVFLTGIVCSRGTWILVVVLLLLSLVPALSTQAVFGLLWLYLAFHSVMNYWRPFNTVPLPRPKVFVLLTTPVIALWIVILAVQSLSTWTFGKTTLLRPGYPDVEWRLQGPKRNPDAELSSELRRGPPPKDPVRLAQLMSEAYKVKFGLNVPPSEILAAHDGVSDNLTWLQEVERRRNGAVALRFLEWRLLLGTAALALGLLSMLAILPGRCPPWLRHSLVGGGMLTPMLIVVLLSLETNLLANYLPDLLRVPYLAIYDHPGMLTAGFAMLAAILFVRHLRAFGTSELADPTSSRR